MIKPRLPLWLTGNLVGFEENQNESKEANEGSEKTEDNSTDEPSDDSLEKEDVTALKAALSKERKANRASKARIRVLEKELNSSKEPEKNEPSSDESEVVKQLNTQLTEEKTRVEALRSAFKDTVIKAFIVTKAAELQFQNPEDVLAFVSLTELDIDQDEEDPTRLDYDEDEIVGLIKNIAKSKPYLLSKKDKEEDSNPSGGSYTNSRRTKLTNRDAELTAKYRI